MSPFGRLIVTTRHCVNRKRIQRIARCASTCAKRNGDNDDPPNPPVRKSVLVSRSTNIFTNLALEDWLYRNYDFSDRHVLLLWRNDPCVVFGRHQNPWKECDVEAAERRGMALARRNSGGGTVYHDNGNLNLSFFTPRERYNRKYNLHIITRALSREWRLESVVNKREDIVVEGDYKISGTAAKLGRPNAYHHCTLLVSTDKENLSLALERKESGIVTNATVSTRSPIKNLVDINSTIEMDELMIAIGEEYLRTDVLILEDEECQLTRQQTEFRFVDPTESLFPGLSKLIGEFCSWNWNFGKTPKFTINRTFEMAHDDKVHSLNLHLEVQNGVVNEVRINSLDGLTLADLDQDASVIRNFCGTRYNCEMIENIIAAISCCKTALKATPKNNIIYNYTMISHTSDNHR